MTLLKDLSLKIPQARLKLRLAKKIEENKDNQV